MANDIPSVGDLRPERVEPTPEAQLDARVAEWKASGALERSKHRPSAGLRILGALAWAPLLAVGYGVGRWVRLW